MRWKASNVSMDEQRVSIPTYSSVSLWQVQEQLQRLAQLWQWASPAVAEWKRLEVLIAELVDLPTDKQKCSVSTAALWIALTCLLASTRMALSWRWPSVNTSSSAFLDSSNRWGSAASTT